MYKYLIKRKICYWSEAETIGSVYTKEFAEKIVNVKRSLYPYIFYYEQEAE